MRLRPDSPIFTVLLGGLAALPSWAIDTVLPAFPTIGQQLAASPAQIGFTIAGFMAGLAVGQLIFGPLSDRFGRRPSLLAGLALSVLSSLACMLTQSVAAMILWRLLGGLGAAATVTIVFAIVRDLFDGPQARARFAVVNMVFGVAPLIAPAIGSWILGAVGWRGIFGALAIIGSALGLMVLAAFGESAARASKSIGIAGLYAPVLANRAFVARVLVDALSFGAMFTFVAGSSLVLMTGFHVDAGTFSLLFACAALGGMIGAWVNRPLSRRLVRAGAIVDWGLGLSAANAMLLVALWSTGLADVATMMPGLVLALFCRGMVMPSLTEAALEPMGDRAGAASGVLGCLEIVAGTAASTLVSLLFSGLGAGSMALTMAPFAVSALALWRLLVRPDLSRSRSIPDAPNR